MNKPCPICSASGRVGNPARFFWYLLAPMGLLLVLLEAFGNHFADLSRFLLYSGITVMFLVAIIFRSHPRCTYCQGRGELSLDTSERAVCPGCEGCGVHRRRQVRRTLLLFSVAFAVLFAAEFYRGHFSWMMLVMLLFLIWGIAFPTKCKLCHGRGSLAA